MGADDHLWLLLLVDFGKITPILLDFFVTG
jgi:hypothetical protein